MAASLCGGLASDAPHAARLLTQAELPAIDDARRAQLIEERGRLIATRPSLGFPVTMIAIGVPLATVFTALAVLISQGGITAFGIVVFGVLIAGSVGMVVIGIISLVNRLGDRSASQARLKVIESQIGPVVPGEENFVPPPPGPPPPPPVDGPPGPPPPPPPPLTLLVF